MLSTTADALRTAYLMGQASRTALVMLGFPLTEFIVLLSIIVLRIMAAVLRIVSMMDQPSRIALVILGFRY